LKDSVIFRLSNGIIIKGARSDETSCGRRSWCFYSMLS